MSKFALAVALTILAAAQGYPQGELDISDAASRGDWDLVHKLIQQRFASQKAPIWAPSESAGNVRSLTPPPEGHVYGEAEYTFKSSSDVDGKKIETKGGHRIINRDGVVTEYDFDPTF